MARRKARQQGAVDRTVETANPPAFQRVREGLAGAHTKPNRGGWGFDYCGLGRESNSRHKDFQLCSHRLCRKPEPQIVTREFQQNGILEN